LGGDAAETCGLKVTLRLGLVVVGELDDRILEGDVRSGVPSLAVVADAIFGVRGRTRRAMELLNSRSTTLNSSHGVRSSEREVEQDERGRFHSSLNGWR
jgi:hypothetical protein